jgi:hypothetical protein
VERLTGNLIPDVSLLDANGQMLETSYGPDRTGAVAQIENYTLPSANQYQILVGRQGAETGTTVGTYRLTVTPVALAEDNPNNNVVAGPILSGTPVTGELTPVQWRTLYTLTGDEGDVIEVHMHRTSGTLYPEMDIVDASGSVLTTGYAERTGDEAWITNYTLPVSGDYTVVATRQGRINGYTTGGYELTVTLLGSGETSARLQVTPGVIEQYDTPVQGEITNTNWYQDWQFRTEAADTITITVERFPTFAMETPNNLLPNVSLLGAAGQDLNYAYLNDTGDQAVIERYTVEGPGTYTIRVLRDGAKTGATTGTYQLTVTLDGSGPDSAALQGATGVVTAGTPVTGQITNYRWADTWTYTAQEGETVDIRVRRTDGLLVPIFEIRDASGASLYTAYPEDTNEAASLTGYSLPAAGDYSIVVYRYDGQNGVTTGSFELSVTPAAQ